MGSEAAGARAAAAAAAAAGLTLGPVPSPRAACRSLSSRGTSDTGTTPAQPGASSDSISLQTTTVRSGASGARDPVARATSPCQDAYCVAIDAVAWRHRLMVGAKTTQDSSARSSAV